MNQVREYLRLLSIFHYVIGALLFLSSLFPAIYLGMGMMFLLAPQPNATLVDPVPFQEEVEAPLPRVEADQGAPAEVHHEEPVHHPGNPDEAAQAVVGGVFIAVGALGVLLLWTLATLVIMAGRKLAQHRSHTYCLVIAGLECLFMPFGTILGVFTLIVLLKPEAREVFGLPSLDETRTDSVSG